MGKMEEITEEVQKQRIALKKKSTRMNEEAENVKFTRHHDMSKMINRNMKVIEGIEELRADKRAFEKKVESLGERLIELKNAKKRISRGDARRGYRLPNGSFRKRKRRARPCPSWGQTPNPWRRKATQRDDVRPRKRALKT